jgi:hypothetical protein
MTLRDFTACVVVFQCKYTLEQDVAGDVNKYRHKQTNNSGRKSINK